jgi:hypothetical protein
MVVAAAVDKSYHVVVHKRVSGGRTTDPKLLQKQEKQKVGQGSLSFAFTTCCSRPTTYSNNCVRVCWGGGIAYMI